MLEAEKATVLRSNLFRLCRTSRETIVLQETPTKLSPVRESCLTPTSFGRNIRFMGLKKKKKTQQKIAVTS